MIERHWKGIARKERAPEYSKHLQTDTFKKLSAMGGFLSAKILSREVQSGVEFLIVTTWQNLDVIKQFTGAEIEKAVVPANVREMMVVYDEQVIHYHIDVC
jgi:heme-degrading monooxygenase HmoA